MTCANAIPNFSRLSVIRHRAHAEEVISKNGIQKNLHIIVKNSPYHLHIGSTGLPRVDFSKVAFEAYLLYDCEGLKEVDYVKVKPMDFKSTPSDNGQQLDVELRIKVLTSQHEDMLFKVKIQGYNPATREELPNLTLFTPSIRVISKPEQIKAKREPSKKRSMTEVLVATVARIEKKQEEQQQLIERLCSVQPEQAQKRHKCDFTQMMWETIPIHHPEEKKELSFEESFVDLLHAFNMMKAEEKPETIRKVVRNSSSRETEKLSEVLDLLYEGMQKEPAGFANKSQPSITSSLVKEEGCTCVDCSHKQELDRIDEFYKEFLSSGTLSAPVMGY